MARSKWKIAQIREVQTENEQGHRSSSVQEFRRSMFYDSLEDYRFYYQHLAPLRSRTYFGVEKTNVVIITYGCTKDQVIILIRGIDVLIFRTILSFSNLSKGSEHYILEAKAFQLTWFEKILQKPPTLKKILRFLKHRTLSMQFKRLECIDPILDIERKLAIQHFKFGVMFMKKGDRTESDLLNHEESDLPEGYMAFLQFLGQIIDLQGWKSYRGGLDTHHNLTGTKSVYCRTDCDHEIMLHVSHFIPTSEYQIERKRNIGNDLVNVIYVENGQDGFDIGTIISKQTHALVLVRRKWNNVLKLQVFVKEGVSQTINLIGEPIFYADSREDSNRFLNFRKFASFQIFKPFSDRFGEVVLRSRAISNSTNQNTHSVNV